MGIAQYDPAALCRPAWNAGQKVGVKKPLKQPQIWEIRFSLDVEGRMRDRALFDLAIDTKLRGCDLVKIRLEPWSAAKKFGNALWSFSKKLDVQFNLKSHQTSGRAYLRGLNEEVALLMTSLFPVGLITPIILALANMPGWSMNG
ncbi:hypothetical protein QBD00_004328 [Ochrobactrum sp. AN78]|nr:hypothetical protein [Ochrobactrum sp. AN78]